MISSRIPCTLFLVAATLAGSGLASAAVPKKKPVSQYAKLWNDSLFTTKPIVETTAAEVPNPLEDYTLAGVGKVKDGWYVVLINKKDRNERIRIKPGESNEKGFQVTNVRPGAKYKEARVEIKAGTKTGWVEYDDKFLVLKKGVVAPTGGRPQQPGQPAKPGQPNGRPPMPSATPTPAKPPTPGAGGTRPSRVRRVPTPPTRGR